MFYIFNNIFYAGHAVTHANQEKGGLGGWWKACPKVKLCGLILPTPNSK